MLLYSNQPRCTYSSPSERPRMNAYGYPCGIVFASCFLEKTEKRISSSRVP